MSNVTLSFDNGPNPATTPLVLDTLARQGILATFFVIGKNLEHSENRALIARAHAEGHWIGNHTYTHSVPLGRLPAEVAREEIDRTASLIGPFTHPSRLFRPYGEGGILDERILSSGVLEHLCAQHYSCIAWNGLPRDWENPLGWVDTALAQLTRQDETLLVLHDIPTGAMANLEAFIRAARAEGVTFQQQFPDCCKLTWQGMVTSDLRGLVTTSP